jgi:DNA-binding NarL/FixJ family response regulator
MRVCWEETGILVPVFRLAGQGFNDGEIASRLNTSEVNVQRCVAWIMLFLQFSDRMELIHYAAVRTEM